MSYHEHLSDVEKLQVKQKEVEIITILNDIVEGNTDRLISKFRKLKNSTNDIDRSSGIQNESGLGWDGDV